MSLLRLAGFFKHGARPRRIAEIRDAPIDTKELRNADRHYLNAISGNLRLGIL